MKKKNILLILLILISIPLVISCKDDSDITNDPVTPVEPEIDWSSKTVSSIEEDIETTSIPYEFDEFNFNMIKIIVNYTDDTTRKIPVEESMLDEDDLNTINGIGTRRFYIYYEGFELKITLKFINSALLDIDLNEDRSHGAVIKAIRDKNQDKIDFIVEESEGITSFQMKYLYDSSIMQLSDFSNGPIDGIYDYKLEDNYLVVTIILDSQITTEIILFSISFTGNFRNSKLKIDDTFNNQLYGFDNTNQSYKINNVLYHVSIK